MQNIRSLLDICHTTLTFIQMIPSNFVYLQNQHGDKNIGYNFYVVGDISM